MAAQPLQHSIVHGGRRYEATSAAEARQFAEDAEMRYKAAAEEAGGWKALHASIATTELLAATAQAARLRSRSRIALLQGRLLLLACMTQECLG